MVSTGSDDEVDGSPTPPNIVAADVGLDICDEVRSVPVLGEVLSTMRERRDDDPGVDWQYAIGDTRFARWERDVMECTVLPAEWRTVATGELFTVTYDAKTRTGADASVVKSLKRLGRHTLNLGDSDILDANGALKPADFQNLFNIDSLNIGNVNVEDIPPDTFKHMPNLTHMGISNGLLEDADLTNPDSFLQHFKGLKSLSLNGNLLTEFDANTYLPENVRSTLESLSLADNPLTETNLDGLDLHVLRIQSTRITVLDDAVLSMKNLRHFS